MNQPQSSLKVGITGLGLIGGSLYKNLVANGFQNIVAHTSNPKTQVSVENDGNIASDSIEVLSDCDLIFVCSPISKTLNMVKKAFEINRKAIIVDVASLKADILCEVEKIENCKFIGSHPMAGTENTGFNSSFKELFKDAVWVLTPAKYVSEEDVKLLEDIISLIGAKPIKMEPLKHDMTVALISHMPMLLSQALTDAVIEDDSAKLLAASGFRDMTRLAMSGKVMAKDMLNLNKNNIKSALNLIIENANKLLDDDYFEQNIDKIIETRRNLYNKDGKNAFRNNG